MNESPLSYQHSSFAGRIGAARRDITPPIGIYARNWGAALHDTAEGIHRPLTVTALAIDSGPQTAPLVLLAMDGAWWKTRDDDSFVRGYLLEQLALEPSRLILNLSHSHSTPSLSLRDRDKPGGHLLAPYLEQVRTGLVEAAREALDSRVPATLTWTYGKCGMARNRDLPDPARPRFVCGFNPAEPADDTLLVGRATTTDGRILATIVNYACHGTALGWGNHLASPDFVGAMRETLESHTGGALSLFLQGPSGDTGPREQYSGDTAVADSHGRQLAFAALAALEDMLPPQTRLEYAGAVESGAVLADWRRAPSEASGELAAACEPVALALKQMPGLEELDGAIQACRDRVIEERLRRKREIRLLVGDGNTSHVSLWIWRLGDSFIVAQPNEAFTDLQIELRRRFPDHAIAVLNVSNGAEGGYLPPAGFYNRDMYEVWQTPYAEGCHERVLEAAANAIARMLEVGQALLPVQYSTQSSGDLR